MAAAEAWAAAAAGPGKRSDRNAAVEAAAQRLMHQQVLMLVRGRPRACVVFIAAKPHPFPARLSLMQQIFDLNYYICTLQVCALHLSIAGQCNNTRPSFVHQAVQ